MTVDTGDLIFVAGDAAGLYVVLRHAASGHVAACPAVGGREVLIHSRVIVANWKPEPGSTAIADVRDVPGG